MTQPLDTTQQTDVQAAEVTQAFLPINDEWLDYIGRWGGRCLECADYVGICPKGLPCGREEAHAAIRHVLEAVNYGLAHGYLTRSSPPITGEGLEERDRIAEALFVRREPDTPWASAKRHGQYSDVASVRDACLADADAILAALQHPRPEGDA